MHKQNTTEQELQDTVWKGQWSWTSTAKGQVVIWTNFPLSPSITTEGSGKEV